MTDREKLIALLDAVHRKPLGKTYRERLGTIADYLLDNGVTFHKWVPVALGFLPDENDVAEYIEKHSYAPEFLAMIKGATEPTVLQYDGELWLDDWGMTYSVTHWMPLPEPPQEE